MKTAVCVAAYNRPQYFKRCIASLASNPEAQTLPFFFYLDGGPNSQQDAIIDLINKADINEVHVIKRKKWVGLGQNLIDVRRQTYDTHGFDRMLFFEEDMVVTPQYISLLNNLADWGFKYGDVATVQASPMCYLSYEDKLLKANEVRAGMEIFSGYAMQKSCWDKISSVLYDYENRFLRNRPYNKRDNGRIRVWMGNLLASHTYNTNTDRSIYSKRPKSWFNPKVQRWTSSQDGITALAMWCASYSCRLTTKVNRATHIGIKGENSHPAYFEKYWAKMKCQDIPGDKDLKDFIL